MRGLLRCPCRGVLAPWGHAVARRVRFVARLVRPRRARCRRCRVTHVLLPVSLFARRGVAGVMIWACVLARVVGVKIAAIAARVCVAASTVASWLRRIVGRASWWRQVLVGVLGLLDPRAREVVAAGSALADAVTVLDAVTAVLRVRGGGLATVTAPQVASHLTRGQRLAPFLDLGGCNTSLLYLPAAASS